MSDTEDVCVMDDSLAGLSSAPLDSDRQPAGWRESTGTAASSVVTGGLDLDLDLWEGQFEFVGDGSMDPWPMNLPTPGGNGFRKSEARFWCEDMTDQIRLLQQQVSALADNQSNTDDKYLRAKQDNATLQARVVMLEEQLREVELRSAERLQEEVRRNREAISRLEREKQLELENCHYRLKTLEKECNAAVEEANRLRSQVERLRKEASEALIGQDDARLELASLQKQATSLQEAGERDTIRNAKLVEELKAEVERLRAETQAISASQSLAATYRDRSASVSSTSSEREGGRPSRAAELQAEIQTLREENRALREANEEFEAQLLTLGLEQGRTLLLGSRSGGVIGEEEKANSLAAELEAMSQDESVVDSTEDQITIEKLRNTLREQQEVNQDLRCYIDGILLNIVENYPQLLEVKRKE